MVHLEQDCSCMASEDTVDHSWDSSLAEYANDEDFADETVEVVASHHLSLWMVNNCRCHSEEEQMQLGVLCLH